MFPMQHNRFLWVKPLFVLFCYQTFHVFDHSWRLVQLRILAYSITCCETCSVNRRQTVASICCIILCTCLLDCTMYFTAIPPYISFSISHMLLILFKPKLVSCIGCTMSSPESMMRLGIWKTAWPLSRTRLIPWARSTSQPRRSQRRLTRKSR